MVAFEMHILREHHVTLGHFASLSTILLGLSIRYRSALVTGGANGLGKAIAQRLASSGWIFPCRHC